MRFPPKPVLSAALLLRAACAYADPVPAPAPGAGAPAQPSRVVCADEQRASDGALQGKSVFTLERLKNSQPGREGYDYRALGEDADGAGKVVARGRLPLPPGVKCSFESDLRGFYCNSGYKDGVNTGSFKHIDNSSGVEKVFFRVHISRFNLVYRHDFKEEDCSVR